MSLALTANAGREESVGWEYASPDGDLHQVRNCSNAGLQVQVERRGRPATWLRTEHGGVYELGSHEFDPALTMQPFGDS